jgi:uncharacterized protein (TIGR03382 family)
MRRASSAEPSRSPTLARVTLAANSSTLTGVPQDVHKIYLIEPSDLADNGTNDLVVSTSHCVAKGVIPAPGALALLGLAGLAGARRRR